MENSLGTGAGQEQLREMLVELNDVAFVCEKLRMRVSALMSGVVGPARDPAGGRGKLQLLQNALKC